MKYFASCSFGKDSVATVLLALEHNEPLDEILFTEVMFDHARNISGEIPEHIDWIHSTAIPRFEAMGVKTRILRSDRDYMYFFQNTVGGGKHVGKIYGFPLAGRCVINRDCKVKPIKQYLRNLGENVTEYIGIAADEPKRLLRLNDRKISLLAKYGYTEAMAKELCEKHNLLSPIYRMDTRGGCWFCPNAKISSLSRLRKLHPDLWQELETLSHTPNMCSTGFKYGLTLQDVALKIDKFDKRQKEAMEIREKQLTLFPELNPPTPGGVLCSIDHDRPRRAKWRVHFKNGNYRDVCGWCVKRFRENGDCAGMSTKQSEEIYTLERYLELKQAGFEFEGQSYLFWEYVRILQELRESNPDVYFLLENVEMGKKWEKVLSEAIGLQGVHINSALVSAQIRKRIYWTNIRTARTLLGDCYTDIPQPEDRGILLRDILEDDADVDEKYYLSDEVVQKLIEHKRRNAEAGNGFGAVFHTGGGEDART